jgi:hypothetical protein
MKIRFHSLSGLIKHAPTEKSTWVGIGIFFLSIFLFWRYTDDVDFLVKSILRDPQTAKELIAGIKTLFIAIIPTFCVWIKTKQG